MSTITVDPPLVRPAPAEETVVLLDAPDDVARWLRSLDPEADCGQRRISEDCPLARYLRARNGPRSEVYIANTLYRVGHRDGIPVTLPLWARNFVLAIDRGQGRVTVAEALSLLDQGEDLWGL